MNNQRIREAMRFSRVFGYEVAAKLGIAESTFYRWLRVELDDDRTDQILTVIEQLSRRGCNA